MHIHPSCTFKAINSFILILIFKVYFLPLGGHMSVLDDGVVKVSVETLLDVGYTLHLGNASDRDLFPFVFIGYRCTHC